MAAVPGKNKVEKSFRFTWHAQDLSEDLVPGTVTGGGLVMDEVEMTGVPDAVHNFLTDHGNSEIDAQFYLDDTAVSGSSTVLNADIGTAQALAMYWGSNGAPQTGDIGWIGTYVLLSANIGRNGNKPVHIVKMKPSGSSAPAWTTHA